MLSHATFASFVSACLMVAAASASASYQYELLTADGRPIRYLLDSNDQGDMVGSVLSTSGGSLDGFRRTTDGSTSFWSTPDYMAYPTAINNAGTIVGVNIPLGGGLPEGFIRSSAGDESPYNVPGALGTIPFGINNDDVISGFYVTPTGRKGFVQSLSGTLSRTVESPGAVETQLFALSDLGLVGGGSWDSAGVVSPFLYDISTETFTPLPKPTPGDNYVVSSVNESGDAIVFGLGSAAENYRDVSSFVFDASEGTLTQLNVPGALETYGYDLRNDGSVLGYYQNPDGTFGGFMAVIPEPTSLSMLSMGIAGLVVRAACRRRRRSRSGTTPARVSDMVGTAPLILIAFGAITSPASADSFSGLGFIGDRDASQATAISDDGRFVSGNSSYSDVEGVGNIGFVWSAETGLVAAGQLPGANFSTAFGISGDGLTAVGASGIWGSPFQATRFTQAGGLLGLGDLPGGREVAQAFGVSYDGSAVVGFSEIVGPPTGPRSRAFRWTESGGMEDLGTLTDDLTSSADAISRSGEIVVGFSSNPETSNGEAFLWTETSGMQGLGHLPGGNFSRATDLSDNGVIVGGSSGPNNVGDPFFFTEAFRWTESGGMVGLGDLPGGLTFSIANAVSADGSVIVGTGFNEDGPRPFYWTESSGMIPLQDYLEGVGLDLSGWTLTGVSDISANGLTFVGTGTNPDGLTEAWVATVPEPSGVVLVGIGLAGAVIALRRRP